MRLTDPRTIQNSEKPRPVSAFREQLHRVVYLSDTRAGRVFDLVLLWLIMASILVVVLESVVSIRQAHGQVIRSFEWGFTVLFTIEYIVRIYSSRKPLKYVFSFYGLIDLIAVMPTYLSLFFPGTQYLIVIRAFRLLRVFRILKLSRFLLEGTILRNALRGSVHKITVFVLSVMTLVTIIGTLMYLVEGDAGGFTSIPVSIYWAIVTVTTVGYGDISPITPFGQFLASILMIIGYGIIAVPTGIVSVEMARATDEARKKCPVCHASVYPASAKFCSNCGHALDGDPVA
ncbi:MAG: ion transporter [Chitinophagaceae bacterium]|nr:MAG: ion transporter [Chitinophagaceae bacterium]